MIWENCKLFGRVQSGIDALNNPVYSKEVICHFQARLTQWSAEDVASLGREYTATHRKLLTRLTRLALVGDRTEWNTFNFEESFDKDYENTSVEVEGVEYDIDNLIDLQPRYRLLYISAYKQ